MTLLFCVGGTLQSLLGFAQEGDQDTAISTPSILQQLLRQLFASFNILSLPLIFLENTNIVQIKLAKMELRLSPSAKTCVLKTLISYTEMLFK